MNVTAPLTAASKDTPLQLEIVSTDRSILDWIRVFAFADDPASYEGQQAEVIGFAYHDPRLATGQVLLGRFTITCCVADATAIALMVESDQADAMVENNWYRVRGPVYQTVIEDQTTPVIRAEQIDEIPTPEQPYLYN